MPVINDAEYDRADTLYDFGKFYDGVLSTIGGEGITITTQDASGITLVDREG